ncbi:MAG: sigma-70 family RNA polymerase sigma factor [Terracidiphilus sp.]
MDTVSSKAADLALPAPAERQSTSVSGLWPDLTIELWRAAEAESFGLGLEEFSLVLTSVGERVNHGFPPSVVPGAAQKAEFYRGLHLSELALAHSCALGRETAWEAFLGRFRESVLRAAISITGSASLGQDLADSLYAELYGLRESAGERRSPLASYSGRGSLMGWLRATLVQRSRDHHRRTYRETPLDGVESVAVAPPTPVPSELARLTAAVARTLRGLTAEDRFLLSAYYLDRQTLFQIAQTLAVHEATISRRLKRLAANLRKQLLENLVSGGLSKAAAEETLGTDPRDIEINLRKLLQTSQISPFSQQTPTPASDSL